MSRQCTQLVLDVGLLWLAAWRPTAEAAEARYRVQEIDLSRDAQRSRSRMVHEICSHYLTEE